MSIEAIKQTLEALESCRTALQPAITSLRQAIQEEALRNVARLGQEIEQEPVGWYDREYQDFSRVQRVGWEPIYTTPQTQQAEKQEPWVWQQAAIKIQWGHDMVVADFAIDKDHTVSVYCERDQIEKVEAMFKEKS